MPERPSKVISIRRPHPLSGRSLPRAMPVPRPIERLTYYFLEATGRLQRRLVRRDIRVVRNVPYLGTGRRSHLLDVYIPEGRQGPLPIVVYVHGGAFMWCSKETHISMGHIYARAGYVVFNLNYRLAPRHPFPAALEDVCQALTWVQDNARRFGGDPTRLVLAGESAGSNLVLALAIACCSPRPEPWARALYEAGITPRAVVAACGILNVCQPRKVRPEVPGFVRRVLRVLPATYVDLSAPWREGELDLADPLHVFEGPLQFTRPLPGFFLPVGTRDPLLDDTRRLAAALSRRGVEHQVRYYPGELHAFHFMTWRKAARRCWLETLRFIDAQLRRPLDRDAANDNGLQAVE